MFQPSQEMLISEWAEQNIVLAKGTTPKPGPYVPEGFQRFIMDVICDPRVRRLTVRKSTQIGWTQIILAIAGYFMDVDPKPVGLFFPREQDAKDKSKKNIAPMIENSPSLKAKVFENKSRNGGNTQTLKQYPGGSLKIGGTNTGAGLRSDSLAVVLKDEVDGWVLDVDGEGSPHDIVERRTDAYVGEEKILQGSTPAKPTMISPINLAYMEGSQTQFYLPCPFCGHLQPLLWRDPDTKEYNVIWDKDAKGAPIASTVRYRCRQCKKGIEERHKQKMLDAYVPIAKNPEVEDHISVSINALYAPWGDIWANLAKEWHKAQGVPAKMQAFVNLRLGEPWDEGAESFDATLLPARRERYDPASRPETDSDPGIPPRFVVPMAVAVLIGSVDVQLNRIEAKVTGFGLNAEGKQQEWHIKHEIFWGAPGVIPGDKGNEDLANVWSELDDFLLRDWQHESGAKLRIALTLVDTGAYQDACAKFIMPRQNRSRRVYASKGVDYLTVPGLVQDSSAKKHKMRLFLVATHVAKDGILLSLAVSEKSKPGYMHYPEDTTDEFFTQLTSESKVPVRNHRTGRTHFEWVITGTRNEALDLTVYARAGLAALQKFVDPKGYANLKSVHDELLKRTEVPTPPKPIARRVYSEGIA